MNWARIDCDIADDPKLEPLPETVQYAYIKVILYCRQHSTGGIVPASIKFRRFTRHAPDRARRQLIDAGALVEIENGDLRIENYDSKQPQSDAERRAYDAARKRLQRARLSETDSDVPRDIPGQMSGDKRDMSQSTVRNGTERTTPPPPNVARDLEPLSASDFPTPPRSTT